MDMEIYSIEELEKKYTGIQLGKSLDQFKIKSHKIKISIDGIEEFNKIIRSLKNTDLLSIIRTPSGGIKQKLSNRYAWDVRYTKNIGTITMIKGGYGRCWTISQEFDTGKIQKGWQAFKIFNKMCLENGIDLEKMAIDNGLEVKKDISSPIIDINSVLYNSTLKNVHHIDFHSSYAFGLMNTHPEFEKVIRTLYDGRKKHKEYKLVLNATIGYMQSSLPKVRARWAHLSRDAIEDNNKRVLALALRISYTKRIIIGFNTDGIWYMGPIYHGDGEGSDIGQWSNDHVDCKFRAKSNGSYEFIENGIYHPVVRGLTTLDAEKDRTKWKWGDIYLTESVMYTIDEENGIVITEGDRNEKNIK